jgi:hypothetical protein
MPADKQKIPTASIADTILGEATQLIKLHDMLQFSGKAYAQTNKPMADKLTQCAVMLKKTSGFIIEDVIQELSRRNFSMEKHVKPSAETGVDPYSVLEDAMKLFPAGEAPATDLALSQLPGKLQAVKQKLSRYMENRDADLAILMSQPEQTLGYIMIMAWSDM